MIRGSGFLRSLRPKIARLFYRPAPAAHGAANQLAGLGQLYAGALVAAAAAKLAHIPLPWMIGPLAFSILFVLAVRPISVPPITRPVGQVVAGLTVGAFMSPDSLVAIAEDWLPILAAVSFTIVAGLVSAALLTRLSGMGPVSANLACIPGGPVEMAALAERYGVDPGPVAFTQLLRIVLLVLVIPPTIALLGGTPEIAAPGHTFGPGDTLLVLLVGVAGGFLFLPLRLPSPFFLGPCFIMAIMTVSGTFSGVLAYWIVALAQVLLGVWLGCTFDRKHLGKVKRMLPAIFLSAALLLSLCAGMALVFSAIAGLRWKTMVLATAPGSVTEMALTAQVLGENVALVTAFHVTRIFLTLPLVPLFFRLAFWITRKLRHGVR